MDWLWGSVNSLLGFSSSDGEEAPPAEEAAAAVPDAAQIRASRLEKLSRRAAAASSPSPASPPPSSVVASRGAEEARELAAEPDAVPTEPASVAAVPTPPRGSGWPKRLSLEEVMIRLGVRELDGTVLGEEVHVGDGVDLESLLAVAHSTGCDAVSAAVGRPEWRALPARHRFAWLAQVGAQSGVVSRECGELLKSGTLELRARLLVQAMEGAQEEAERRMAGFLSEHALLLLPPSLDPEGGRVARDVDLALASEALSDPYWMLGSVDARRLAVSGRGGVDSKYDALNGEALSTAMRGCDSAAMVGRDGGVGALDRVLARLFDSLCRTRGVSLVPPGPHQSRIITMLEKKHPAMDRVESGVPVLGGELVAPLPPAGSPAVVLSIPDEVVQAHSLAVTFPLFAELLGRRLPMQPALVQRLMSSTASPGASPRLVEGMFPLGLALSPDPIHPTELAKLFDNVDTLTASAVTAAHTAIRGVSRSAIDTASSLFLSMARSGREGRSGLLSWVGAALALNGARSKDHFFLDPRAQLFAASSSFMMHLALSLIGVGGPVFEPLSPHLKKVDPSFLLVAPPAIPDPSKETCAVSASLILPPKDSGERLAADLAAVSVQCLAMGDPAWALPPGEGEDLPGREWALMSAERVEQAHSATMDQFGFSSGMFWLTAAAVRVGAAPMARHYLRVPRILGSLRHREGADTGPQRAYFIRESLGMQAFLQDSEGFAATLARWAVSSLVWTARALDGVPMGSSVGAAVVGEGWREVVARGEGGGRLKLHVPLVPARLTFAEARSVPPEVPVEELQACASSACVGLIPEWLLQDVADVAIVIAREAPEAFDLLPGGGEACEAFLEALTALLASPSVFRSPHIAANFGEVLLRVFVPPDAHPDADPERPRHAQSVLGCSALLNSEFASQHLPSALMHLFGAVERTGFYEMVEHRFRLMGLLQYLWDLPKYRVSIISTARGERGESVGDRTVVDVFANGIITQTSSTLNNAFSSIERVVEAESRLNSREAELSETERDELFKTVDEESNAARGSLRLFTQSLTMLRLLAGSAPTVLLGMTVIETTATTLLRTLFALTTSQATKLLLSRERKAQIGFQPRELLADTIRTVTALAKRDEFVTGVLETGMLQAKDVEQTVRLLERRSILDRETLEAFKAFCSRALEEAELQQGDDDALGELPFEVEDGLACMLLRDATLLPSGNIVCRSTLLRSMESHPDRDPYTRQAMSMSDVRPLPELDALIGEWASARRAGDAARAEAVLSDIREMRSSLGVD
jgi:hypothetical protein